MKFRLLTLACLLGLSMKAMSQTGADTLKATPHSFTGFSQYNTWSVGINAGVTAPSVATGGFNTFNKNSPELGYGVSVKDQLSYPFGIQLDLHGGNVAGSATGVGVPDAEEGKLAEKFNTQFLSASLSGVLNFGNISFLHRKNGINFYFSGGAGLLMYAPKVTYSDGTVINWKDHSGADRNASYTKAFYVPIGSGVKFKLTDQLDLNVGYTENFVDELNFDGAYNRNIYSKSKYSYGYAGLEYTLGSKSKQSLQWVNPIAVIYDELYDPELRREVEALKGRVTNIETAIADLKKDSDGDGVSDQFDKCPNTPAGTVVDGSGCPIVFPKDTVQAAVVTTTTAAYSNIQFEFDSSVLRTSSYPVLDATSADLRSSGAVCELAGYASSEGTAAHNLRLSKDRANSVKTYLVNSGVAAKKLKARGFGTSNPIADNSTDAGRILNRRVEFKKQ